MKKNFIAATVVSTYLLSAMVGYAAETTTAPVSLSIPIPSSLPAIWNFEALSAPPKVYEPTGELKNLAEKEGLRALFYETAPYQGKPTRTFAWYGAPKGIEPGKKVPAIVLVHGGGGTAFAEWVKLWNGRGFAAIAMDNCGQLPICADINNPKKGWRRNPDGGPRGWGGMDQIHLPIQEQWTYHAVTDVILAHSLIRSFPEVDAERTGITGISWGGYLTCIAAGVDSRFKFAAPVYGCGFLGENSTWKPQLTSMGQEKGQMWLKLWDPSQYLPFAKMPMLWVTGTNDFAYPMDSLQKSYRLPTGERKIVLRIRMPHGHGGAGENPKEILAFADSVVNKGTPLAKLDAQEILPPSKQDTDLRPVARVKFWSQTPIKDAVLAYTADDGVWKDRKWESVNATLNQEKGYAEARLPAETKVWYFMLTDERGLLVSSEHSEVAK